MRTQESEASTRRDIGVLVGPMTQREAYYFVRAFCEFSQHCRHRFDLQIQEWQPADLEPPSQPPPRPRDDGDDYPPGRGWEPVVGVERVFFWAFLCAICGVLLAALFLSIT